MRPLLWRLHRSAIVTRSGLTNPKCMCFNVPKAAGKSSKLPLVFALISGSALGYVTCYNKSSIFTVLSKLKLYNETVESHLLDSQVPRSDDPAVDGYLKLCEAVMKIAGVAILSTTTMCDSQADGEEWCSPIKCRAVGPFPAPPGLPYIYFMTNKKSRKFSQIQRNPSVVLTYLDGEGKSYVTFEGRAQILSDEESTSHWMPYYSMHIPEGPVSESAPDSRFVVIKLIPSRVEFSSVRFGYETAHDSWLPPAMIRDGNGEWKLDPLLKIK